LLAFQFHLVKKISQGFEIFKYFSKFLFVIKPFVLVVNFVFEIIFQVYFDKKYIIFKYLALK
jgi:hypothetical protein